VEYELAFARTGSELPAVAHGIFWMDQRGVNVPAGTVSSDSTYQQVGEVAADELLVTFGETHWDATTRCAGPVAVYGGSRGHWTFMDQQGPPGPGSSSVWSDAYKQRAYTDFCFRSDKFDEIDLHVKFKLFGVYWTVPWSAFHFTMVKKPWGWDRQTTSLLAGSSIYHYPVFQIVDGDGKRTEHYDAYLKWANSDTTHTEEGFHAPINRGKGTSLVGRLAN
jgi:Amt family ammonium transporter